MKNYFCSLAFGDSLISLSQLEALEPNENWRVLGSGVAAAASSLLRRPIEVVSIFEEKPAYNTIKERGLWAAAKDFAAVYAWLRQITEPGDTLAFERRDVRNSLLAPRQRETIYPNLSASVYVDRQQLVQQVFGQSRPWVPVQTVKQPVRHIVVNPCARYPRRWLSDSILGNLLALCAAQNWSMTLIDPCEQYAHFAAGCAVYLPRPKLSQSAEALRSGDLYIGPDSFFIHLAYYFGVPHFGFFFPDHLYFMTPGMLELGNWCTFDEAANYEQLNRRIMPMLVLNE